MDYYKAKEHLEKADSYFADGAYEDARTYYELAEKEYDKYRAIDELYYCGKRVEECENYKRAEKHYLRAEKYLKEKDYNDAFNNFMLARNIYEVLGDEDLMQKCDSYIEVCEKYIQAEEYYLKAEQCLPFQIHVAPFTRE